MRQDEELTATARIHGVLARRRRRVALATYGVLAAAGYALAFLLRFELNVSGAYTDLFWKTVPILVAVRVAFSLAFRLSLGRWRFVSVGDVKRLVQSVLVGTAVFLIIAQILPGQPRVPLSVILLEAALTTNLIAGCWLLYRWAYEKLRQRDGGLTLHPRRVLIVGAGEAAFELGRAMLRAPTGYHPVGYVDDDPLKHGTTLLGSQVLGTTAEIAKVALHQEIDEIVIAIPSASPERLRRIVNACERTGLPFKVLPGISEVLKGNVSVNQLREVRIEDLLGREPIQLELPELAEDLNGKSVLITGAAGSIGSELARQVALNGPATLVLFDQAETDLFFVELELREKHPDLQIVPVVGDIVDASAVERVFEAHRPNRVFHAAAYKHVPMMEANAREAVRNNVIGTWRVAEAAGRFGAGKFVLVSTDKAVRPANVMGATKRLAEIVVLELQEQFQETAYSAVRFGNVLGSNGSVIPIFRKQLAEGKPLTVTHPDATRFFMTIPEAVQLILQASLLPKLRGRIAMLDMGEPVRIRDLAVNILHLSGVREPVEDRIVYTGLRPGEKLHEELAAPDERTEETAIPKVFLLETYLNGRRVVARLPGWDRHLDDEPSATLVEALTEFFPGLAGQATMPGAEDGRTPVAAGSA